MAVAMGIPAAPSIVFLDGEAAWRETQGGTIWTAAGRQQAGSE